LPRISRTLIATSLFCLVAGAPASEAATLWIADDTANMIYEVTLEGSLITSFPQVRGGDSCIAVDFTTDTLWSTAESKDRAVNFSKAGELPPDCAACVPEIDLGAFGAEGPEGVGVSLADDVLWVVDDPVDSAVTPQVFQVALDGTLLSSFPASSFDPASSSPQAIAVDPDGTLWITDNRTERIYHVTQAGALIGSFSVLTYTGVSDPEVRDPNPQGITVDRSNGTLWVSDRATSKIYNVTSGRHGELAGGILFYFDSTTYDASSLNPTGVAYDGPSVPLPPPSPEPGFSDGFESALWSQDGQNDWKRSTQRSVEGSYSAEVDGSASDAELVSPAIDLGGATVATLSFAWLIESGVDSGEYLACDVSVDGGGTWTEMARLRGNVDPENTWQFEEFTIEGISSLRLRFRGKMSKSSEDANVDNVTVDVADPQPAPAGFAESFEDTPWNAFWTQDGQNDWKPSRQRSIDGTYSAEVDGWANDARLVSVPIDLVGATRATVGFSWYIEGRLDSNEYLAFDVSINGGASWTEKARLRGNVDPENRWHGVEVEVENISTLRLRFRGKMSKSNEDANVDDIWVLPR
jgi:hypothetical protein